MLSKYAYNEKMLVYLPSNILIELSMKQFLSGSFNDDKHNAVKERTVNSIILILKNWTLQVLYCRNDIMMPHAREGLLEQSYLNR